MKLNCSFLILILFFTLSCSNSKEQETYKIYNTVLKEKVSTYGIMVNYLPYDRHYSDKEIDNIANKISDSLIKVKSLTYYLDRNLTILDTLNPSDYFASKNKNDIIIENKPTYSKNKIDFSKITSETIGKRVLTENAIDENQKEPTYLGSYSLSEPIFISKENAVIRYIHYCGGKCGLSLLIYLKKEKDFWKIIDEKMIWIS